MRDAGEWAKMYAKHVRSNSPEELEAFAAAIQMDTIHSEDYVTKAQYVRMQNKAPIYPKELFE